ncbi:unnamed protein product [Phytophthora lilii]|uniref:Unnamed protein product n=1 Tax=Phytophthora lilii TaxID=2077276 RepID=A0A9W6XFN2_9STRA|nr:unnamed protein product [Phytophthora lilii]
MLLPKDEGIGGPKASVAPAATLATEDTSTPTVTEAPTVVEADADDVTEAPTEFSETSQFTTPAPATESSYTGQGSPLPSEASNQGFPESSNAGQGSFPAQTSADGSADESVNSGQGSFTAQTSTGGSTGGVSQTDSSNTTGHASFGDVTSASGQCVVGDPNTYLTGKDADWIWINVMAKYVPDFKNLIFDQLITNKGALSYCVRWDNDKKLSKSVASKFEAMLTSQLNLWHDWLVGYDCWPIEKISVDIVGYAVRDASLLDWSDDSLGKIYEGILDSEGSPQCPDECYKHLGQAKSADTSACKGKPFDMSLWPSTKPGEGAIGTGGDWGQRVEVNDMLASMDQEQMMVLLHEIGHGFGLPELYVAENKPRSDFPPSVMDNSLTLTDADGWVLRRVLENIKTRYDF